MPKPQPPRTLNLLQEAEKPVGTWDKIYMWVFNVGRYLIIVIEIVVLLGFAARFTLDRKNNDLKDNIAVKVNMVKAQSQVEAELRRVQSTLDNFSQLIDDQTVMSKRMGKILDLIPSEITLESFSINQSTISIQCTAPTYQIAQKFEDDLRNDDAYESVRVTVEKGGSDEVILFTASINFATEGENL